MSSNLISPSSIDLIDWRNPIAPHPLNDGLVAWYLAGAPGFRSGTWRDLCGKHHGALTNMTPATAWQATSRPGGWGQLDLVSASSQSVIVPSAIVTGYPFTLSIWVRPDALTGVMLSTMRDDTGNWTGHYMDIGAGKARAISVVNNTFRVATSVADMATGDWQQVTGVFASATSRVVYLNDVPGTENTESSSPTGMVNTVISGSKRSLHDNFFDGLADSVSIWNRDLSATEVRDFHILSRQHYPGLLNRVELPWYAAAPAGGSGSSVRRLINSGLINGGLVNQGLVG